jgi:hypothetical protein
MACRYKFESYKKQNTFSSDHTMAIGSAQDCPIFVDHDKLCHFRFRNQSRLDANVGRNPSEDDSLSLILTDHETLLILLTIKPKVDGF